MDHIPLHKIVNDNNLSIVTNDSEAWVTYPDHNIVYNKLWLAKTQGLPCAPIGVYPSEDTYPIIIKPIINLYGMSRGVVVVNNDDEYDNNICDGFFWERYLTGLHVSLDLVIRNGNIYYHSCMASVDDVEGTFEYHYSLPNYTIPEDVIKWVKSFLGDYTGCVNMELINNIIIECHLRLNGDSQLYNADFYFQLHNFLRGFTDNIYYDIPTVYLIPIFVNKDLNDKLIDKDTIRTMCRLYRINSIYFQDIDSKYQSEYKSRLLIFDIDSLKLGLELKRCIVNYINKCMICQYEE